MRIRQACNTINSPVSVLGELSLLNKLERAELNGVEDGLLLLLAREQNESEKDHAEGNGDLLGMRLELLDEVGRHNGIGRGSRLHKIEREEWENDVKREESLEEVDKYRMTRTTLTRITVSPELDRA